MRGQLIRWVEMVGREKVGRDWGGLMHTQFISWVGDWDGWKGEGG